MKPLRMDRNANMQPSWHTRAVRHGRLVTTGVAVVSVLTRHPPPSDQTFIVIVPDAPV